MADKQPQRSPVNFGFDEAVWCPRTADEVLWTMQSYFPDGEVTATPYAGATKIPLEPEPIYARKKGAKHEVIATRRPDHYRNYTVVGMLLMALLGGTSSGPG